MKFLTIYQIVKILTLAMGTRLLKNSQKPFICPFKRIYAVGVGIYQRISYSLLLGRIDRIEGTTAGNNRDCMRQFLSPIKWTYDYNTFKGDSRRFALIMV